MKLYYDLHLHSCLSPCASNENTPADLVNMCALAGLDVIALTDHNSTGNCAAFLSAAQRRGLLALPGMELTTAEEVHVICLFPDLARAQAFGRYVTDRLPPMRNDPRIFGQQLLMDSESTVLGEDLHLLSGATVIPISALSSLMEAFSGVAYPAHIDRTSFSLLSNLGFWDRELGFPLAEISPRCPEHFAERRRDLRRVPLISSSDAHALDQIADARYTMDLPERSAEAVLAWLRRGCGGPLTRTKEP